MTDKIEEKRQEYASFENYDIEYIVNKGLEGLDANVAQLLIEEIVERGLDTELIEKIEVYLEQFKG